MSKLTLAKSEAYSSLHQQPTWSLYHLQSVYEDILDLELGEGFNPYYRLTLAQVNAELARRIAQS
jgi:hypothetical protein